MSKLPKDCPSRVIGAEARKLVHYKFSTERWEFHEITGTDRGLDCFVELVENDQWINKKIEGQIKGTRAPAQLKHKKAFSFSIDVKTINYGLSSSNAFVIFYVDVDDEMVYYVPLQDYFISDPSLFNRLEENKETMKIHIPCDNILSADDYDLQQIAKSTYVEGPTRNLRRA